MPKLARFNPIGNGDDVFVAEGSLGSFDGGNGTDTVSFANEDSFQSIVLSSTPTSSQRSFKSIENVIGSLTASNTIFGSSDDNTLSGGDLRDTILGQDGDDIISGGKGADWLAGGNGFDIVSYLDHAEAVKINLGSSSQQNGDKIGSFEGVIGSRSGDDTLFGTDGINLLMGAGGDDVLYAGAGDDFLYGDAGDDLLLGGGGADELFGGSGRDTATYVVAKHGVLADLQDSSKNVHQTQFLSSEARGDVYDSIENLTGSQHKDNLRGDAGANVLIGLGGSDFLFGRDGNDILYGGQGADNLYGGNGVDTASYAGASTRVVVDLEGVVGTHSASRSWAGESGAIMSAINELSLVDVKNTWSSEALGDRYHSIENVTGSRFNDTLSGDSGANLLSGLDGDDVLSGRGGNDVLYGGKGSDVFLGGDGQDTVSHAAATAAVLVDLQDSGKNIHATQFLNSEARGDVYDSIENATGSRFADNMRGDNRANALIGLEGNDILFGRDGNDLLYGGAGEDRLFGGSGTDTASYAGARNGVLVDLEDAAKNIHATQFLYSEARGDAYDNIENATGSRFNDNIRGDAGANLLSGLDGNDVLFGRNGDDVLYGGKGNDRLFGGSGNDTVSYVAATSGVLVDLADAAKNIHATQFKDSEGRGDTYDSIENATGSRLSDNMRGDDGANILKGLEGDDVLFGRNGNDILIGGQGADRLFGGTGDDLYYIENIADRIIEGAAGGTDRVMTTVTLDLNGRSGAYANVEHVTLTGTDDLNVYASNAANVLIGNSGNNILSGRAGRDILNGRDGDDTLAGGTDADTFYFDAKVRTGDDEIIDFQDGLDVIKMTGVSFNELSISHATGDTVVAWDESSILVKNVDSLTIDDFIFF